MKAVLKNRNFAAVILILIVVCLGVAFAGDVIVKEGSEYIADKLGIRTTSPTVALDVSDGEVKITGSDGSGGDAPDVLVVTGGTGASGYKGSDIKLTAGDSGGYASGGNVEITSGLSYPSNYYCGNIELKTPTAYAKPGKIILATGSCYGGGGDIELTTGGGGGYGDVILAKNGGKVGIGTDSPASTLDVDGKVTMNTLILPVKTTTGHPSSPGVGQIYVNTADNGVYVYADGAWRELTSW